MENTLECKVIEMKVTPKDADLLLMQLEELTDQKSIYFSQEVYDEKEEIREKILKGEITIE